MQHRLVDGVLFLLTLLHGNLRSGNLIMGNSLNESLFVEIGNIGYSLESKDLALDMGIARFTSNTADRLHLKNYLLMQTVSVKY